MLKGGEDPKFIARRLIVAASEDVGNADPRALEVAVAAGRAVEFVGLPEARIALAQATTYIALAPKSNASYRAIDAALGARGARGRAAPAARAARLQPSPTPAGSATARATRYPHDHPDAVLDESLLPEALEGDDLLPPHRPGPGGRAGGAPAPPARPPDREETALLGGGPGGPVLAAAPGRPAVTAAAALGAGAGGAADARAPWAGLAARGLAVVLVVNEVVFYVVLALDRGLSARGDLPLHLTDAATIAAVIALWRPSPLAFELTYFWAFSATVQALLTPGPAPGLPRLPLVVVRRSPTRAWWWPPCSWPGAAGAPRGRARCARVFAWSSG